MIGLRLPPTKLSFSGAVGAERLLLLGVRLMPRRPNRALARDLETDRLRLRSIGPLRLLWQIAPWHRDPELMEALRGHRGPMPLIKWLSSGGRPNNIHRFCYAIVPKGQSKPVGVIYMNLSWTDSSAATHMAISDPAWRGHQVSVEARSALLTLFFDNGVTVFTAEPRARNLGSIFVYKKLGFRVVGAVRFDPEEAEPDRIRFVMTREAWRERQARIAGTAPSQPAGPDR